MIKTNEDLEAYLGKLERRFERLDNGTYLVGMGQNRPPIALRLSPPVLLARVEIGKARGGSAESEAGLYRRLLELNARDLLHAAYGIDDHSIVLSAALENETADLNELEAVFSDIDMALAEHISELRDLVKDKA
jgi:CesT_Tir_1